MTLVVLHVAVTLMIKMRFLYTLDCDSISLLSVILLVIKQFLYDELSGDVSVWCLVVLQIRRFRTLLGSHVRLLSRITKWRFKNVTMRVLSIRCFVTHLWSQSDFCFVISQRLTSQTIASGFESNYVKVKYSCLSTIKKAHTVCCALQ